MAHPFARFVGELFPQLPCELFDIPETFTPLTPAGIAPQVGENAIMGARPIYVFAEPRTAQARRDKPCSDRFEDVVNLGILMGLRETAFRLAPTQRLLSDAPPRHALARLAVARSTSSAPASATPAIRSATRPATCRPPR